MQRCGPSWYQTRPSATPKLFCISLTREFLSDKTVPSPSAKVNQGSLYVDYGEWCKDDSGVRPISKKSFTHRLAERGYPEGKSGSELT
jgi:phage/plasmid-associated DNA primase